MSKFILNFNDFCKQWAVTPRERRALAFHLAMFRAEAALWDLLPYRVKKG